MNDRDSTQNNPGRDKTGRDKTGREEGDEGKKETRTCQVMRRKKKTQVRKANIDEGGCKPDQRIERKCKELTREVTAFTTTITT